MILEKNKRFLTPETVEAYWNHSFGWVGHPRCENQGDVEKEFIENREKLEIIGGVVDETLSYEYDEFAVVRYKEDLYLLETSGCSCPSPVETWHIIHGPITKEQLLSEIKVGNYQGYSLPGHLEKDLLAVVESA